MGERSLSDLPLLLGDQPFGNRGTHPPWELGATIPRLGVCQKWTGCFNRGGCHKHLTSPPPACHCLKHRHTGGAARAAGCFVGFARQDGSSCSASNKQKKTRELKVDTPEALTFLPLRKRKTAAWLASKHRLASTFFSECCAAPETSHSKRSNK